MIKVDKETESDGLPGDLLSENENRNLLFGGTKALSGCLRFFLVGIFLIIIAYLIFLIFRIDP